MKKSLVFLAAVAAMGGASAQSSVSLYGIADVAFGQFKSGVGTAETTNIKLESSGLSSSRWGMKGSDDLGGGLKAEFVLEAGMNVDTGAQKAAGVAFDRVATVGLSGSFGAVALGRQALPYDSLWGDANNTFDNKLMNPTKSVWLSNTDVAKYKDRGDNAIVFKSAKYGGFSGSVGLALGENKGKGVGGVELGADQVLSMQARYADGPLMVGFGYQTQKSQNAATTLLSASSGNTSYMLMTGSYDLGMAKLIAGYNQTKRDATINVKEASDDQFQVGVDIPLSSTAKVGIGYATSKGDVISSNATSGKKGSGFSVVGVYDLSKRTTLYGGLLNTKAENAAGVEIDKSTAFAGGIRHKF